MELERKGDIEGYVERQSIPKCKAEGTGNPKREDSIEATDEPEGNLEDQANGEDHAGNDDLVVDNQQWQRQGPG